MENYKVISLLQPWASLLVLGHKTIETRSWNTQYRGKLLIHASLGKQYKKIPAADPLYKHYHTLFAHHNMPPIEHLPFGQIIGSVDLIDTETTEYIIDEFKKPVKKGFNLNAQELAFGDYSPNRYGWLLVNPVLFKNPIPAKGQLNLWNWEGEIEL